MSTVSAYVNPLPLSLRTALDELATGDGCAPSEDLFSDYDRQLDFFEVMSPRESDRCLVAEGRESLQRLRDCFSSVGNPLKASGEAFRLVRALQKLEAIRALNSPSKDIRLGNLIYVLQAYSRGEQDEAMLVRWLNRCQDAWTEWMALWDSYSGGLDEKAEEALNKGFNSLLAGLQHLGGLFEAQERPSPKQVREAAVDVANGCRVVDQMFLWHERRSQEADSVPVIGRVLFSARRRLRGGEALPSELVTRFLSQYLPALEDWWDENSSQFLLSEEEYQRLEQRVSQLLEGAEEMLSETHHQLSYVEAWFVVFAEAAQERFDREKLSHSPWGSFLLAVLQDGVPYFLLENVVERLAASSQPREQEIASATQAFLGEGDRTAILELLETISQESVSEPTGGSSSFDLFLC